MRLISQDGKVDIPYENSVVNVHVVYDYNEEMKYNITGYKIITPIGDNTWELGYYSTKEKALCVMEMLRQQYNRYLTTVIFDVKEGSTFFKFPTDESVK